MIHRTNTGSGREVADAELRDVYRGLAVETTPQELDTRILAAAREQLRQRQRRTRRRYGPLAVAATVTLCVALVLDLGVDPESPVMSPSDIALHDEVHKAAVESRARKMSESKAEKSVQADVPAASPAVPAAVSGKTGAREDPVYPAELGRLAPSSTEESSLFRQASDGDAEAGAPDRMPADGAAANPATACSDAVTEQPATWLECIVALESAGRMDLAKRERARFDAAYPDHPSVDD